MSNPNPSPATRFKPGEVANPKGRTPNIRTFSETVCDLLDAKIIDVSWTINNKKKTLHLESNKNMHYGVVSAIIMEALKGNIQAANMLADRLEGKPKQNIGIQTVGVAEVVEEIVHADKDSTS